MPRLPILLTVLTLGCSVTLDLDRPPERVTLLADAAPDVVFGDSGRPLDGEIPAPDSTDYLPVDFGPDEEVDGSPDAAPDVGLDATPDLGAPLEPVEIHPVGEQQDGQSIGTNVGTASQSVCREGRLAIGLDALFLQNGILAGVRVACAPVEIRPWLDRWVLGRGDVTFGPWIGREDGGIPLSRRCGEDAVLFGVAAHTGLRILTIGGLCRRLGAEPIAGGGWGISLLEFQETEIAGVAGQGEPERAQCLNNRMAVGLDGHWRFEPLANAEVIREVGVRCDAVEVSGP